MRSKEEEVLLEMWIFGGLIVCINFDNNTASLVDRSEDAVSIFARASTF